MIPQETIQRIYEAADIVEIVSDFVSLKKAGTIYKGLCPFHHEKTPSFTVSPSKGIFKCFGCGKGGSAVNFVMEHEHLSYPEALKYIAKKYHIEIEERELSAEEIAQKNERESMLIISQFASKWFSRQLWETSMGKAIGLSYFRQKRGFRDDIIKKFGLGYSPEERDAFTREALKQGYKKDFLVKTGLTIAGNNYAFDRFNGRVIFPIHNLSGKVIGFGGRTMRSDKKIAKYLNSIESEIYHKSDVLYGMYQAKSAITKFDKCYLVEGYTDVISMHQAGIENVVASSGTSLTTNQIRLIHRFTENLTVLYDGDAAGIKASLRGIDMILAEGMNVKVLLLPDGEDPDSFSQKLSADEFIAYIQANEKDFIQFKAQLLIDETQNDPIKRAQAISSIVQSVSVIPDSITRSVFVRELSKSLDVPEETLYAEIGKKIAGKLKKAQSGSFTKPAQQQEVKTQKEELSVDKSHIFDYEKTIVQFLLIYGENILYTSEDNEELGLNLHPNQTIKVAEFIFTFINSEQELELKHPVYSQIYTEFLAHWDESGFQPQKYFVNHPQPQISAIVADLISDNYVMSKIWNKNDRIVKIEKLDPKIHIPKTLWEYKYKRIQELMKNVQQKLTQTTDKEEQNNLLMQFMRLKDVNRLIAKELGDRIIF